MQCACGHAALSVCPSDVQPDVIIEASRARCRRAHASARAEQHTRRARSSAIDKLSLQEELRSSCDCLPSMIAVILLSVLACAHSAQARALQRTLSAQPLLQGPDRLRAYWRPVALLANDLRCSRPQISSAIRSAKGECDCVDSTLLSLPCTQRPRTVMFGRKCRVPRCAARSFLLCPVHGLCESVVCRRRKSRSVGATERVRFHNCAFASCCGTYYDVGLSLRNISHQVIQVFSSAQGSRGPFAW